MVTIDKFFEESTVQRDELVGKIAAAYEKEFEEFRSEIDVVLVSHFNQKSEAA